MLVTKHMRVLMADKEGKGIIRHKAFPPELLNEGAIESLNLTSSVTSVMKAKSTFFVGTSPLAPKKTKADKKHVSDTLDGFKEENLTINTHRGKICSAYYFCTSKHHPGHVYPLSECVGEGGYQAHKER